MAGSQDDFAVMAALEKGIPLEKRPFRRIARDLDLDEDELLERVRVLIDSGAIRRLAVLFDSRAMGFSTTLVAARARNNHFGEAVALVNAFDEVTHNYRRACDRFGMWFTLTAAGRRRIDEILDELRRSGLFEELVEMPAEKVYKVRTRFARHGESDEYHGT